MRIRWRGLELPSRVLCDEQTSSDKYAKFMIEPFERGFGTTVGNSLRRILLSSLEGAAVTRVKIASAPHEFTALPGVLEDVTDIVLNIKGLAITMNAEPPRTLRLVRNAKGAITASDIEADASVEIVNGDHHIATLTDDIDFAIEMVIDKGRGWRPADENMGVESEVGMFPIDSSFSPVTRVRYKTEDTRVGQKTNYDRLILEVWTNGTLHPEDALVEAAKILRKHLNPFVQYHELGHYTVDEAMPQPAPVNAAMDAELQAKLNMKVTDMRLSVRANNCLESARVATVGELVKYTEGDLLRVRSFGKTSLREVKHKLMEMGLSLGMDIGAPVPEPVVGPEPEAGDNPLLNVNPHTVA
jgi:DNA-directed RNA polymerase subunit alpha